MPQWLQAQALAKKLGDSFGLLSPWPSRTWENRFPSSDPSPTVNPVTMGKVNHLSILNLYHPGSRN